MERARHSYTEELKQRLVEEIERGALSVREAARDARTSITMVQKWLEEYGRFKPKRDVVEVVMKSEQDQIAALKQALADAHLKLVVYDELITQANKRYKTDLKKKLWYASAHTLCGGGGYDVTAVCRALDRSRDAYYKRGVRRRAEARSDAVVLAHVATVRVLEPRVGTRKLQHRLATAGVPVGRDALFTLLRDARCLVPRKRRSTRTTYARHQYAVAPNRLKTMDRTAPSGRQ